MKCVIGLGNPGSKFHNTKHNFGFWIIDRLIEERSLKLKAGKGDYVFAVDQENMFVKPTTFVNNSGIAVTQILNYYKNISIKDIVIIYDDIDIDLGNIRFRPDGSDGGHNGIKSIIYHTLSDVFDRLKIGIATNTQMRPSEKYVLKPFSKESKKIVSQVIENAQKGINYYLENGIKKSMNNFNKKEMNNGK